MKKIAALFLCCTVALGALGCAPVRAEAASASHGEIDFWSTYATEKILQDKPNAYDAIKMNAEVNVEACKGEYESAQIIMTATKAVEGYDARITGDLTGPNGATFAKTDIDLRVQKYIRVAKVFSGYNNPPTGMYPDALLPLETAVAYKENSIAEGENQGLYITFHVPVDQEAGVYTGNLNVTYDGQEKNIPVRLTVYDLTVSQETRSMSYFNLGFSQHLGEMDSTQAMWRKYAEALLEYRISPSIVMRNYSATEEGMREYVDEVYDLVKNHGMSTINAPWKNGENLTAFLVELAKKSIEENVNLLEKTIAKGPDEPSPAALNSVKTFTASFHTGVNNAIAKFDGLKTASTSNEFIEELKASAQNIPLLIALQYDRNEATDAADVDTYCPLYDKYDSASGRAQYDDQTKGKWWYGCVNPRPPYPTYHTEDTLVSARSVGWMMSEYDVVGNLYWAVSVYASYNGVAYHPLEDYYNGSAERFHDCNGDGYLFYPAAPYGLDKPVASLRLEAIRDGNEEYELLYDLKEKYAEGGASFKGVQRAVSDVLYSGTKVRYENVSAQFAAARKAMLNLALMANSPANVLITDVTDDNKGTVTYTIDAKQDYTVKNDGVALVGTNHGDRTEYVLAIKRENETNKIALRVEAGSDTYAFDFDLGGKVDHRAASELLDADNTFVDGNATVTATLAGDRIELIVDKVEVSGKRQSIRYNSAVLRSITAADKKLVLFMHNPSDKEIPFRILVKQTNNRLNNELFGGTLKAGDNTLEIDLSLINIAKYGSIEYADLYFGASSDAHEQKTVYLTGLSICGA